MNRMLFYPAGGTPACRYAAEALAAEGAAVIDHPAPEITHLLLDAPSLTPAGELRGGGSLEELLRRLPEDVTVVGGGLNHPALAGRQTIDLLEREDYLCANAALTASCALRLAAEGLDTVLADTPTVIIGWGRIAQCLARMLTGLGAPVTIAARRERDRAMAAALGYGAAELGTLPEAELLINTAPGPLALSPAPRRDCRKLDLASRRGLEGEDVLWARGLPGRIVPRSSGALMAQVIGKAVEL